jgi:hypothetical protein
MGFGYWCMMACVLWAAFLNEQPPAIFNAIYICFILCVKEALLGGAYAMY